MYLYAWKKMLHSLLNYNFAIGVTPQNPTITHTSLSDTIRISLFSKRRVLFSLWKITRHFLFTVTVLEIEMEAPDYFVGGGYYGAAGGLDQFSPEKRHGHGSHGYSDQKPCEPFAIDDLLDFSNADAIMSDGFFDNNVAGNSTDSSTVTAVDSCNSSGDNRFGGSIAPYGFASDVQLTGELCVPVSNWLNATNSA